MRLNPLPLILLALLLRAAPAPAQVAATKSPAPSPDAVKQANKMIDDIFKSDLAAARTPQQRADLMAKLTASAVGEKDPATQYALLQRTLQLAVDLPAVDVAERLVDKINELFALDEIKFAIDTAAALQKTVRAPDELRKLAALASSAGDKALAADRFDLAKQALDIAVAAARGTGDPALTKDALAKSQRCRDTETAFAAAKIALALIADHPADAEANLTAGKFYCLVKGDWEKGLPMLALGSDAALKTLAAADISNPAGPDAQIKTADAWWDYSTDKLAASQQFHARLRAETWYRLALPSLTGLAQARVEKRLTELDAEKAKFAENRIVNLLSIFKPENVVGGKWELKDSQLLSEGGRADRMQFPYHPPAEYDFRVEFMRTDGDDSIVLVLTNGAKNFMWQIGGWRNTVIGFETVDGKRSDRNVTTTKGGVTSNKRCETVVKVRKTGVEAYIDGKLVASLKANFANLTESEYYPIPDKAAVGLGAWASHYTVFRAEIVEISGRGTIITPAAPH